MHFYSQTCEQRPTKGKTEYGLYRQVVFTSRSLCLFLLNKSMAFIYRVVFILRWYLTQVWLHINLNSLQRESCRPESL